jgi:hypothetical protein
MHTKRCSSLCNGQRPTTACWSVPLFVAACRPYLRNGQRPTTACWVCPSCCCSLSAVPWFSVGGTAVHRVQHVLRRRAHQCLAIQLRKGLHRVGVEQRAWWPSSSGTTASIGAPGTLKDRALTTGLDGAKLSALTRSNRGICGPAARVLTLRSRLRSETLGHIKHNSNA